MELTKLEIKGRKFDIHVSDQGRFYANLDGDQVTSNSLDDLKSNLAKRMRRTNAKVSIPFVRWERGELRKGTITGIHASNRNVLVRWEGAKGVDQEYSYSASQSYINPEVMHEYCKVALDRDRALRVFDEFCKEHGFDGREAVREEMAKQGIEIE